jgi:hypothetical protein
MARIFALGQFYVALSRCLSLKGLQILNFDAARILTDPRAILFYSSLKTKSESETLKRDMPELEKDIDDGMSIDSHSRYGR